MKTIACFTGLLGLLLMGAPLMAIEVKAGDRITISEPLHEDLYVAGGEVTINAPLFGDLIAAGGKVTINDTITGDLLVGGGEVIFNGYAGDDIRAAGGTLHIRRDVGGDLVVTGGEVLVDKDVLIAGDVLLAGGEIELNGTVGGSLRGGGGQMVLNGAIERFADIRAGDCTVNGRIGGDLTIAAKSLKFGDEGRVAGNLRYWLRDGEGDFGRYVDGDIKFDESLRKEYGEKSSWQLGFASFGAIVWYLLAMTLLLALVLILMPGWLRRAAGSAGSDPARMLGAGFLLLLLTPALALVFFMTVIGIPVGLLLLAVYGILLALGNVLIASVGVHWIRDRYNYDWKPWQMIAAALGIMVVLRLLFFIPIAGWLLKLVVLSVVLGALYTAFRDRRSEGGLSF